jgi:hypothetical protein
MRRVSVLPCLCPFVLPPFVVPPLEQALGPIRTLGSVSVLVGAAYAAVARVSCDLPFSLCYDRESISLVFEVLGSESHLVRRWEGPFPVLVLGVILATEASNPLRRKTFLMVCSAPH